MAQTAHTPGPWEAIGHEDHDFSISHDGDCDGLLSGVVASGWTIIANPEMDELAVAVIDMNYPNHWDDDLHQANVALVKSAPEMKDGLIEAEALFRQYGDLHAAKPDMEKAQRNYDMADKLAAIIAKATTPA